MELARIRLPVVDSDAVVGVVLRHAVKLVAALRHADDVPDHLLADPLPDVPQLVAPVPRSSVEGLELHRRSLLREGDVTLTRRHHLVLRPTDSEPKLITNSNSPPHTHTALSPP